MNPTGLNSLRSGGSAFQRFSSGLTRRPLTIPEDPRYIPGVTPTGKVLIKPLPDPTLPTANPPLVSGDGSIPLNPDIFTVGGSP